jgi:hypothetical protein
LAKSQTHSSTAKPLPFLGFGAVCPYVLRFWAFLGVDKQEQEQEREELKNTTKTNGLRAICRFAFENGEMQLAEPGKKKVT